MRYNQIKKDTYFKINTIAYFLFCFAVTQAQTLKVGPRIQKTQNMYWENGISAQYSFENFKPNQFLSVLILYHPD
jgi:hypothetical protein